MRRLFRPLAALTLACMAATLHAASSGIHEDIDPNTGLKTLMLADVHTHNCPGVSTLSGDLNLVFTAHQLGANQVEYTLSADLASGTRLNIRHGDTLDMLTDGVPGRLIAADNEQAGHEHAHHVILIRETVPFNITREQLESLGRAQVFQFTLNGKNASLERCVYAKDLKDLPEFLDVAWTY